AVPVADEGNAFWSPIVGHDSRSLPLPSLSARAFVGVASPLGGNLGHIGQDLLYTLLVEFAFLESVVGFHLLRLVQKNGYICLFGQFVVLRTGWLHDCQIEVLDSVLHG